MTNSHGNTVIVAPRNGRLYYADLSLLFKPADPIVRVYADSDHAGDTETSLSISGVLVTLGNSPVLWTSKKQDLVAKSTAHSEYQALFEAVELGRYFVALVTSLGIQIVRPPTLYWDNEASIAIATSEKDHPSTKALRIRLHTIREALDRNEFQLRKIPTEDNLADLFTKSLAFPQLQRLTKTLFTIGFEGEC